MDVSELSPGDFSLRWSTKDLVPSSSHDLCILYKCIYIATIVIILYRHLCVVTIGYRIYYIEYLFPTCLSLFWI